MTLTTIIDASYGDTGKARIIDLLLKDYDVITKSGGSSNAGHTIVHNNKKYITRIMPSGILYDKPMIIGQGVLLDIEVLLHEIEQFKEFNVEKRLFISDKCHVLFPYHKAADAKHEIETNSKIGSTRNGVAYCVQDKYGRRGIRVCDLFKDNQPCIENIGKQVKENMTFWKINDRDILKRTIEVIGRFVDLLSKSPNMIIDTADYINSQLLEGKSILNEVSQGTWLDIDNNYYPYATSSHCTTAGVAIGLGIAPQKITKVVGLTKAYTTRVGGGPFPTELFDEPGDTIRKTGDEFGSNTKRPRRVGWLNLDELLFSTTINGFNEIAITKVDVLNGIEKLKVMLKGKYIDMEGWNNYTDKSFEQYINLIEDVCKVPVKYISFGADRNDMVIK